MSSRRTSPTMPSSRTRTSAEAQRNPRHAPRTLPQATSIFTSQLPHMAEPSYTHVSAPMSYFPSAAPCLPHGDDTFFSGNDGAYIPTSVVAPMDLNMWDLMTDCTLDNTSGSSSSSGSLKSLSPPMTEAELLQTELYPTSDFPGVDQFTRYPDPWIQIHGFPPSPPIDPMFDIPDMFNTVKDDPMAFGTLPDSATECEYLGVSKLQFSRALPRHSQPRPIRSASERSPESSVSGSPKDEPMERTKNNPRNDPRYDAKADKDGYYHCPYAAENCNHKPTKQKCIYAKNLDSHLKPYTCKYGAVDENCRTLRFSSNACLFRHEREMHGLHNHGINPYLCKFPGCERARRDNGFPRRWNQRDHMKRVHGWEEPDNDDTADRGYTDASRRRKGPGASTSVPMKRTGSARAHPYQGQTRNISAPRYNGSQMQRELQAQNMMASAITVDPSHYTAQPMLAQPYGSGMYMRPAY